MRQDLDESVNQVHAGFLKESDQVFLVIIWRISLLLWAVDAQTGDSFFLTAGGCNTK